MSIALFTGPMFSGKTTLLIREYERAKGSHRIAVKPQLDSRHASSEIVAHSGEHISAISVSSLTEVEQLATKGCSVFVDEGQFFRDLAPACCQLADKCGALVFVAALNGTAERTVWPAVAELIPHINRIEWAPASTSACVTCSGCKKELPAFTARKGPCKATVDVGGSDKYESLCRTCYNTKVYAGPK